MPRKHVDAVVYKLTLEGSSEGKGKTGDKKKSDGYGNHCDHCVIGGGYYINFGSGARVTMVEGKESHGMGRIMIPPAQR